MRVLKFIGRCAWEFLPPLIVAGLWVWFGPEKYTGGAWGFYASWLALSWTWLGMLRIWYQQNQRSDVSQLGIDLRSVKGTVEQLREAVQAFAARYPERKEEIEKLQELAETANNQVNAANTAYESARSYTLKAETGHYKIGP